MVLPLPRRRPLSIKPSHPKVLTRKLIGALEELAELDPLQYHAFEALIEIKVKQLLVARKRRTAG